MTAVVVNAELEYNFGEIAAFWQKALEFLGN
jgi:hypothetical protein